MATFDELYQSLDPNTNVRGRQFEHFESKLSFSPSRLVCRQARLSLALRFRSFVFTSDRQCPNTARRI